jgi:hypothetical protein
MRGLLILRGAVACLVGVAAVVAFLNDEPVFGALLAGFAIANGILVVVFARARIRTSRRPPAPPARRAH